MKSNKFIYVATPLSRLAGLLLVGALGGLVACGGGNAVAPIPPQAKPEDKATVPVNTFGGFVYAYQLGGATAYGPLNATVDGSANITIKRDFPLKPELNYNFTFMSGLPGAPIGGAGMMSFEMKGINKLVNILTPTDTRSVQNVFWRNLDNLAFGGFAQAGYPTDITKVTWPATGTAVYKGKAFQYFTELNLADANKSGLFLFSSDVTATVDYAAKTLKIEMGPNTQRVGKNPDFAGFIPEDFTSTLNYSAISYSSRGVVDSTVKTGYGLNQLSVNSINFFGPQAQELGGFLQYDCNACGKPTGYKFQQYISFALVKQ